MDTPKVNQYLLRISAGYATLLKPLKLGEDLHLMVDGTVTQITDKDNQDGTVDRVYTVKAVLADEV